MFVDRPCGSSSTSEAFSRMSHQERNSSWSSFTPIVIDLPATVVRIKASQSLISSISPIEAFSTEMIPFYVDSSSESNHCNCLVETILRLLTVKYKESGPPVIVDRAVTHLH